MLIIASVRRMPQLLETQQSRITFETFRTAWRLSKGSRWFRKAEQTIEFRKNTDGAQPQGTVHVEFFKDPKFESFDRSVKVFLSFFELANPFLQAGDHKATFGL